MPEYQHRFTVRADVDEVAAFHRIPANLGALTPPPAIVRTQQRQPLRDGDQFTFTIWFGLLPVRWLACIEALGEQGFLDRQISGPFESWEHSHRFTRSGPGCTEIADRIVYTLKRNIFWRFFGWGMGCSLPLLFAYRRLKTKSLLENQTQNQRRIS